MMGLKWVYLMQKLNIFYFFPNDDLIFNVIA